MEEYLAMVEALGFSPSAGLRAVDIDPMNMPPTVELPKKRKTRYQAAYKRNFNKLSSRFKKQNGQWKVDGFRNAVRAAHKATKKQLSK
tara:strand:+ start:435 stop:698 length:264 start_codon:yes stop_codon:yes gene_type:complete